MLKIVLRDLEMKEAIERQSQLQQQLR